MTLSELRAPAGESSATVAARVAAPVRAQRQLVLCVAQRGQVDDRKLASTYDHLEAIDDAELRTTRVLVPRYSAQGPQKVGYSPAPPLHTIAYGERLSGQR